MPQTGRKLTIYQKPTCTTCRQTVKLVEASGQDFETVDYYEQPFSRAALAALLKRAGLKPREVLRSKEEIYKKLKLGEKELSDEELVGLMVKHPDLIQRPLVDDGGTVILARPADSVKKLLKK